ncbi:SDR family NAD(P)-dependent oxidoreductase [Nonomuraea sp. H19]|uniref:SDR family NAD(P)-dependent oxidoreductase n=1 Tax=Nonomuraea sp. H19 TaxID=3452206 RepID=UPI003F8C2F2B
MDVLLYNGAGAAKSHTPVLEVSRQSAQDAFDGAVLGAVTAVRAMLPAMLERGSGTLLFTSGISAVHPLAFLGNIGIAVSGLRNYALSLAQVLGPWRRCSPTAASTSATSPSPPPSPPALPLHRRPWPRPTGASTRTATATR